MTERNLISVRRDMLQMRWQWSGRGPIDAPNLSKQRQFKWTGWILRLWGGPAQSLKQLRKNSANRSDPSCKATLARPNSH